jgi:hypothetical protein
MTWEIEEVPIEGELVLVPELNRHCDVYGAWIEVPMLLILLLNIKPSSFSTYSYIDDDCMLLEEDLDAPQFTAKFEMMYAEKPVIKSGDSDEVSLKIRGMSKNLEGWEVTIH